MSDLDARFHETWLGLVQPPGESSGSITFRVDSMATTGGRPILDALVMLLDSHALFTGGVWVFRRWASQCLRRERVFPCVALVAKRVLQRAVPST